MGATRGEPLPRLRVGTFWGVGGSLVPAICRRIGSAFAQIDVHEETSVETLLERPLAAQARSRVRDASDPRRPIRVGFRSVVTRIRSSSRVAATTSRPERPSPSSELGALPVLTLDGCRAQAALELVLQAKGRPLKVEKRLDSVAAVLAFVADGFGVGLLPSLHGRAAARSKALQLDPRIPPRMLALAWHRDTTLDGLAQDVVDAAVAVAARSACKPQARRELAEQNPRRGTRGANPTPY